MYSQRVCPLCGETFQPLTARQKYCMKPHIVKCEVCDKEFERVCNSESAEKRCVCSTECRNKIRLQSITSTLSTTTKLCKECGQPFTPRFPNQLFCDRKHTRKCVVCGKEFDLGVIKNTADIRKTCSEECYRTFMKNSSWGNFKAGEFRDKCDSEYLEKTGYAHPAQNPEVQEKMRRTYEDRTGYSHPSHNPDVRSKAASHSKMPMTEKRVEAILKEYGLEYKTQHFVKRDEYQHVFDFYVPCYKLLIDVDGLYYHSYLDDPDGRHVLDYYDNERIYIAAEGYRLQVLVEGHEDDLRDLMNLLIDIDKGLLDYDTELFKWCRSTGFPYPQYDESRMQKDYRRLREYSQLDSYVPSARLGDSLIRNFHRSIWNCRVGNYPTPLQAWNDDKLLKKVIANRLVYKNDVDPSKVLAGFNISKICPRVSIFNPVLAKYIVTKYLSEFGSVFDPFSGFSGRMLGVTAADKYYFGQDINKAVIDESRQIIKFLDLHTAYVGYGDIFGSDGKHECLLTCPPYGSKEHYLNGHGQLPAEKWVEMCLERFQCKKYAFVVDDPGKYKKYVKEEIKSTSHFSNVVEHLVVI